MNENTPSDEAGDVMRIVNEASLEARLKQSDAAALKLHDA